MKKLSLEEKQDREFAKNRKQKFKEFFINGKDKTSLMDFEKYASKKGFKGYKATKCYTNNGNSLKSIFYFRKDLEKMGNDFTVYYNHDTKRYCVEFSNSLNESVYKEVEDLVKDFIESNEFESKFSKEDKNSYFLIKKQ